MRACLVKVLFVLLLCNTQPASGYYDLGLTSFLKTVGVIGVGLTGLLLFTGVRGCMRGQALNSPDFFTAARWGLCHQPLL